MENAGPRSDGSPVTPRLARCRKESLPLGAERPPQASDSPPRREPMLPVSLSRDAILVAWRGEDNQARAPQRYRFTAAGQLVTTVIGAAAELSGPASDGCDQKSLSIRTHVVTKGQIGKACGCNPGIEKRFRSARLELGCG